MKTTPEIMALINSEISKRSNKIQTVIEQLQILKNRKEVTEDMKVSLIKYATEISEHKAVINSLKDILLQIG